MKVYIIGAPGSGKTTFAKVLSQRYNIQYYELDLIVFDDENNHIRRTDEQISKLFDDILKKESYIIEDVGRSRFKKGILESDIIYYLSLSKFQIMKRIVKRWMKQKVGIESYNYPPTWLQLLDFIKVANSYFKKEQEKLKYLEKYNEKVIYLNLRQINELINNRKL